MMSQAIRKLGHQMVPLPQLAMSTLGSLVRQSRLGLPDFSPEQLQFLTYGRGVDTTQMRNVLGFNPRYTTEQALVEFASSLPAPARFPHPVVLAENVLSGVL